MNYKSQNKLRRKMNLLRKVKLIKEQNTLQMRKLLLTKRCNTNHITSEDNILAASKHIHDGGQTLFNFREYINEINQATNGI